MTGVQTCALPIFIDACSYPLPKIGERTRRIRPVGLGIMGLADASILQGIVYGSPEFELYCRDLGCALATSALSATAQIVSEAGKEPFPEHPLVRDLFAAFKSEVEGGEGLFSEGTLFSDSWFARLSREECGQLLSHMKRSELVPLTLVNTLSELDNPLSGLDFEEIKAILKGLVNGRLRNSRRRREIGRASCRERV